MIKRMRSHKRFIAALAITACFGIGMGTILGPSSTLETDAKLTHHSLALLPSSVEEMIQTSDAIVIGEIKAVASRGMFHGYGERALELAELERSTGVSAGISFVDFEVEVSEVIMSDKILSSNDLLILRTAGNTFGLSPSKSNEPYLMCLKLNPDQKTYGFASVGHLIRIDDKELKLLDGVDAKTLDWIEVGADTLVDEIRQKVVNRGT